MCLSAWRSPRQLYWHVLEAASFTWHGLNAGGAGSKGLHLHGLDSSRMPHRGDSLRRPFCRGVESPSRVCLDDTSYRRYALDVHLIPVWTLLTFQNPKRPLCALATTDASKMPLVVRSTHLIGRNAACNGTAGPSVYTADPGISGTIVGASLFWRGSLMGC